MDTRRCGPHILILLLNLMENIFIKIYMRSKQIGRHSHLLSAYTIQTTVFNSVVY